MSSVRCCPECGSSDYYTVVGTGRSADVVDHRYGCNECDARFRQLDTRAPEHVSTRSGLAGQLAHTDPDVIGGEASGE